MRNSAFSSVTALFLAAVAATSLVAAGQLWDEVGPRSVVPRAAGFVAAPTCCVNCAAPLGCCCAPRNKVPATVWVTRTSVVRRTRTAVLKVTKTANAVAARSYRDLGRQTPSEADIEPVEDAEPISVTRREEEESVTAGELLVDGGAAPRTRQLLGRNLCPVCPAGVQLASGKTANSGSQLKPCCPRRKTTTRTKILRRTAVKTVTSRQTITRTAILVPKPNQTVTGILFFDVDGSGTYDPSTDLPVSDLPIALARLAPVAKARAATVLDTDTSSTSGEYKFSTNLIEPNDTLGVIDERSGKTLITIQADSNSKIPTGPYNIAISPTWTTSSGSKTALASTSLSQSRSATRTNSATTASLSRTATLPTKTATATSSTTSETRTTTQSLSETTSSLSQTSSSFTQTSSSLSETTSVSETSSSLTETTSSLSHTTSSATLTTSSQTMTTTQSRTSTTTYTTTLSTCASPTQTFALQVNEDIWAGYYLTEVNGNPSAGNWQFYPQTDITQAAQLFLAGTQLQDVAGRYFINLGTGAQQALMKTSGTAGVCSISGGNLGCTGGSNSVFFFHNYGSNQQFQLLIWGSSSDIDTTGGDTGAVTLKVVPVCILP